MKRQQKIYVFFEENLAQIRKQMNLRKQMKELERISQRHTIEYLQKRKKKRRKR